MAEVWATAPLRSWRLCPQQNGLTRLHPFLTSMRYRKQPPPPDEDIDFFNLQGPARL
jgi:hypothetical protein